MQARIGGPTDGVKDTTREILTVLGAWIKGQFLISLWVTGLYLVGFAIARTPLWPVLAILCGVASVIPHVGGLLALGLVLLFSFVGSGGETWVMVAALAVWVLVSLIEAFILGPRLMGRKLGLNPWLVLLAGIVGAVVGGPIGMLIATPLLAIALVIWRRSRRTQAVKH